MTHIERDDLIAGEGEQVVELDTGELVAARCVRQVVGAVVHYHATARVIDEAGEPVRDAAGQPVARELRHQARGAASVDAITEACISAVLGEPQDVVPWGDDLLIDVSIREAIALAPLAG